jgi:transcription termination/antitermination protein NusA
MDIARGTELVEMIEAFAREKGMSPDFVFGIVEQAICASSGRRYGKEQDIRATINRKDGSISLYRVRKVVDNVFDVAKEISLEDAKLAAPQSSMGDLVKEPLPPMEVSSGAASVVRRVLSQQTRLAEREREYQALKDRVGDVVSGTVKSVEVGGGLTVTLAGYAEGFIPRKQLLTTDSFKAGERVKCYISNVEPREYGPQVFLSRTHEQMLVKLFSLEVPEVYDGLVQIKAVAREAGAKSKIAVYSVDAAVDPVRACVGPRGSRVQSISSEFNGEKIDVVPWSDDLAQFAVNALAPASIEKVVIHRQRNVMEVVISEGQLNLAIGRRGQNVRLASKLIGWEIRVMSEEQESEKRLGEFQGLADKLVAAMDIDEILAQLLVAEGFGSVEQIVRAGETCISNINGLPAEVASELYLRAKEAHSKQLSERESYIKELGVDVALLAFLEGIKWPEFVRLVQLGVKSIEDLAEISIEEFDSCMLEKSFGKAELEKILDRAKELSSSR